MHTTRLIVGLIALLLLGPLAGQAQAKFEPAEEKLYRTYLDLQVEEDNRSEYYVYAIVKECHNCSVVYLLVQSFKGQDRPWTSFRCDVEFKVLSSSHGGLYDIKCTSKGFDGTEFTHVYYYDGNDYVRN